MIFNLSHASTAQSQRQLAPTCYTDDALQKSRSKALTELVKADQNDRKYIMRHMTVSAITKQIKRDLIRRKHVGEIMAEGCFKTASDYAAAAMIYQHGDVSDHYYQAFVWANRAVALGDVKQKALVAMSIDRYLISMGKKQLFGTQFYAENIMQGGCFCLQPVEHTFPDKLRMAYTGKKLSYQYRYLSKLNHKKTNCPSIQCPTQLSPTLKGSIVGFW